MKIITTKRVKSEKYTECISFLMKIKKCTPVYTYEECKECPKLYIPKSE